jgi:hypothetical protein
MATSVVSVNAATAPPPSWSASYTSPAASAPSSLRQVVALSSTRALAAGYQLRKPGTGDTAPLILRWNGVAWSPWKHSTAAGLPRDGVYAMAATSLGNVWLSTMSRNRIRHWNGHRWTQVSRHGDPFSFGTPFATKHRTWLAGTGGSTDTGPRSVILRFRSGHPHSPWKREWTLRDAEFGGVDIRDSHDIWVVGALEAGGGYIARFNGKRWERMHLSQSSCAFRAVTARSANDALAVGSTTGGTEAPCAARWNGHRWKAIAAPNVGPNGILLAVTRAPGAGHYWAAGGTTGAAATGPAARYFEYTGTTWNEVDGPSRAVPQAMTTVWSLAHIAGTSHTFSAGLILSVACVATNSCPSPSAGQAFIDQS